MSHFSSILLVFLFLFFERQQLYKKDYEEKEEEKI